MSDEAEYNEERPNRGSDVGTELAPRAPWLTPYRWKRGRSGNPRGRPKESGSLAAALRRAGVRPANSRAELIELAQQLGMDPEECRHIDVLAGLILECITQLLIRTIKGNHRAGDKLVGLLQVLSRSLEGDDPLAGGEYDPDAARRAVENVSRMLGLAPPEPCESASIDEDEDDPLPGDVIEQADGWRRSPPGCGNPMVAASARLDQRPFPTAGLLQGPSDRHVYGRSHRGAARRGFRRNHRGRLGVPAAGVGTSAQGRPFAPAGHRRSFRPVRASESFPTVFSRSGRPVLIERI